MDDDELVKVLGESILAATAAVRDGKPQAALDMIDVVHAALPAAGLEIIELAALPTKIIALARLGRTADARDALTRMENLTTTHGSDDDRLACHMLREQIQLESIELTARAKKASEAILAGQPEGVTAMEAVADEAQTTGHHVIAIGALTFLGKVYGSVEQPDLARVRLLRAKELLELHRPLDADRHARAIEDLDNLLASLPSS